MDLLLLLKHIIIRDETDFVHSLVIEIFHIHIEADLRVKNIFISCLFRISLAWFNVIKAQIELIIII